MSKKRKSFILHHDSLNVLDDLTNEQAGLLFKAIKSYQLNEEMELDAITNIAMSPFKNQFERDAEKYEKLCEKNRLIAEARYNTKSTTGDSGNQTLPKGTKSTDNDSDSKSDSNSNSNSNKDICQQVADEFNKSFDGELSTVVKLTDKRKAGIRGCIAQMKGTSHDFTNIDTWLGLFDYIKGSDFLMGRKTDWSMNFDFLVNKSNLIKIIEGQYENE